jgi:hypothetical protein
MGLTIGDVAEAQSGTVKTIDFGVFIARLKRPGE